MSRTNRWEWSQSRFWSAGIIYISLLLAPSLVMAQVDSNSVYVELRGGVSFPEDDDLLETGGGLEGAVGYAHESGARGEFAFGWGRFDIDANGGGGLSLDGDLDTYTFLWSGYYDLDLGLLGAQGDWVDRLRPYAGFGLGFGIVDIDADLKVSGTTVGQLEDTDTEFAWQFALGASYAFSPDWAMTGSWSYLDVDEEVHNLKVGVRYSF